MSTRSIHRSPGAFVFSDEDDNRFALAEQRSRSFLDFSVRYALKMSSSASPLFNVSSSTHSTDTLSTLSSLLLTDHQFGNLSCYQLKYDYISQKSMFKIVRYISHNLNRFFILPAIVLNLCAFYILRRTRMNRSSSIAFYMQTLALCDVAFFALRVIFAELSSSTTGKHILTTGLCKFLFLMVNAVNYTTGRLAYTTVSLG